MKEEIVKRISSLNNVIETKNKWLNQTFTNIIL